MKYIVLFSLFFSIISCDNENNTIVQTNEVSKLETETNDSLLGDTSDTHVNDTTDTINSNTSITNDDSITTIDTVASKDSTDTDNSIDSTKITEPIDSTNVIDTTTQKPVEIETPTISSASFSFTTSTSDGDYAPNHVKVIWIEDSLGNVVKTLGRWAVTQVKKLSWYSLENADIDVVTGATKSSHGVTSIENWNLHDKKGEKITQGEYILKIEYNENDPISYHKISESNIIINDSISFITRDETNYIYDLEIINNR